MAKKKAGKKKAGKKKAAKKKAAKKKKGKKKSGKKKAGTSTFFVTAAVTAADVDLKTVTFTNSNPDVLVNIEVGGEQIIAGTRSATFAPGNYDLFYRAEGAGSFNVTVTGATLSSPIAGTAPTDGVLVMTVPS